MITKLIQASIQNRSLLLIFTAILLFGGGFLVKQTPVDAIPDLSDVQVIIKTSYAGQAPQVVQDQVTYPLTTAMLSVPKATTVRGFSFFGDSYVYIIFEDGTDLYWARSRVLEYLSQVAGSLPAQAKPELGPDATGVGWIYQYALQDKTGAHDLAQLRSYQDWFLKYELQAVPGVAEIATIGGMVKQYQVVVDPNKLAAYKIPLSLVNNAIQQANQETGASVIEMAEAEYMVRVSGYLQGIEDLKKVPLGLSDSGRPLLLEDIADIVEGPQMRRGIAELNGEGEVVGGIVVMRFGENAQQTIKNVKAKLAELQQGLPAGIEIVEVYDRSGLIDAAVSNLLEKLSEEMLVVALVCGLFLLHLRSSLVVILTLPVGILMAFIVMYFQGINANIMSLGGIAIAIGAMVDGAIVMVENFHKHWHKALDKYGSESNINEERRWDIVKESCSEVGPALFFSLLIITVSFLPVFALEAQEGRLFAPLAFTKTYAMAASAILAVTLVPVLIGYLIRGKIITEAKNPLSRVLSSVYKPIISWCLSYPKILLSLALSLLVLGLWPLSKIGSEFMPPLDEGDLMYMPTTYAGVSVGKAREILQQTDKLIKTVPEVKTVFGKIGRAETATDPAPLTMIETVIQFKPESQWREGVTKADIRKELEALIQFPGLSNAWVMPIKTRIDMLATGIKTPVGIKVSGPDLKVIEKIGRELEIVLQDVEGTASVYSERVTGGRYINVDINRFNAARFGLSVAEIQQVVQTAIGGKNVTYTVEGQQRFPVNVRYPQVYRDSAEKLKWLPIVTKDNRRIALSDVADISIGDGPPVIKSENARINGWTLVDIENRDLGSYVEEAQKVVAANLNLPAGYALQWSGQYEYMQRAKARLKIVVPVTLLIIVLLLYLNFRRFTEVLLIVGSLPFALIGAIWFLYLADFNFSVAVGVGMIALAGLSVEIGILMLTYLHHALDEYQIEAQKLQQTVTAETLKQAIIEGASLRLRPIMMTVATVVIGLIPVMSGTGVGGETMQRIAAPMVGGMVSCLLLTLLVLPVLFYLWQKQLLHKAA
ncbi:MAG: efflux RND transporter permease subunit [Pseudomonadales bacterium]|nr:efflux RND transporter permease subunit [Pseudomonadales bacterium]